MEFKTVYVELKTIFMTPDIMNNAFALTILFAPERRCPIQAIPLRGGRVFEIVERRQDVAFNSRLLSDLRGCQSRHCGLKLSLPEAIATKYERSLCIYNGS